MPPMARRTVFPLPNISHANPTRGSKSNGLVTRYPLGVLGSVPSASPSLRSPAPGTNVPTRFVLVNSCPVRGSFALRLAVAHAALVKGTVQNGTYRTGAIAGSYSAGSKYEP